MPPPPASGSGLAQAARSARSRPFRRPPRPAPPRRCLCRATGAGGAGACWRGRGARVAARGGRSSARPRPPGDRMAEPTRAAKPGRFALRSPRCREGAVPGASAEKPKKKAFYLLRMKPLKEPAPNNNNNVSFVIHCQLGKEIKHICSNCSRGEDARDGECRGPSGRQRRAREAGRWFGLSQFGGTVGVCRLENCGDIRTPPRHDTRPPSTLQSDTHSPTRARNPVHPIDVYGPQNEGFETVKRASLGFSFGSRGLGDLSVVKELTPAFSFHGLLNCCPVLVLCWDTGFAGLRYGHGLSSGGISLERRFGGGAQSPRDLWSC